MRWAKVLGSVIFVLAIGLGSFSYLRSQSFHGSKPRDLAAGPLVEPPVRISSIVVPVDISFRAMQDALNNNIPKGGEDHKRDTIPVLKDDDSRTLWSRAPLSLTAVGQQISLGGGVSVDYRVDGKILFARTSAEAKTKGTASIRFAPALQDNWRIKPNLSSFQVNLEEANLRIAKLDISVKTKVSDIIRKLVADKLPTFEATIAANDIIRTTLSKKWSELCSSRRANAGDASVPPTYIEIKPIAASAGQPKWDAVNLSLLFGIEAQIRLTDGETHPICPFPEKLKLIAPQQDGEFSLNVPLNFSFASINDVLRDKVAGRTFKDAARNMDVEVRSVKLQPAGDMLLVASDISVRKGGILGLIDGRVSGTVYLLAKPVIDADTKTLRLQSAKLDVQSNKALSKAFGQVAAAVVETVLSRESGFNYARELDRVRARANTALAELADKPGPVRLSIAISDLNVTDLAYDKDRAILAAAAKGRVSTEVVKIGIVTP